MKKFFISIIAVLTVFAGAGAITSPVYAADPIEPSVREVCEGLGVITNVIECIKGDAGGNQIERVIRVVLNILSVIAGFLAVVMIMIAGLKYITSGGESSKVAGAKITIIYAIIGLVVVAFSQVIVLFVLSNV